MLRYCILQQLPYKFIEVNSSMFKHQSLRPTSKKMRQSLVSQRASIHTALRLSLTVPVMSLMAPLLLMVLLMVSSVLLEMAVKSACRHLQRNTSLSQRGTPYRARSWLIWLLLLCTSRIVRSCRHPGKGRWAQDMRNCTYAFGVV